MYSSARVLLRRGGLVEYSVIRYDAHANATAKGLVLSGLAGNDPGAPSQCAKYDQGLP